MSGWAPPAVVSLAATLAVYQASRAAERRWGVPGLLLAAVVLVALMAVTGAAPKAYASGTSILTFLLGPATVALAVPLYEHRAVLRRLGVPIVAGVAAGSAAGMAVVAVLGPLVGPRGDSS